MRRAKAAISTAKRAATSGGVSESSRSAWSRPRNSRAGRGVSKFASRARVAAARVSASLQWRDRGVGVAGELLGEQSGGGEWPSPSSGPSASGLTSADAERGERVGVDGHDRAPPKLDLGEDAGHDDARREAGAQQRRLARPRCADQQQEGSAARFGRRRLEFAQAADRLVDEQAAAEEHALPALVESGEAGEGRAEPGAIPHRALGGEAAPRQPLPQAIFDLGGEFVGRLEFLEGGEKLAGAAAEPGLEEPGQPPPLGFDFGAIGGVERDQRGARPAEDIDVGHALAALARFDRAQDFVGRARRVGLARRHVGELLRQRRTEPRAEDRHDEIAGARLGNLRLECLVRRIVARLPADRANADTAGEFSVEPLDDEIDPLALGLHVARRGDEEIEDRLFRHLLSRGRSFVGRDDSEPRRARQGRATAVASSGRRLTKVVAPVFARGALAAVESRRSRPRRPCGERTLADAGFRLSINPYSLLDMLISLRQPIVGGSHESDPHWIDAGRRSRCFGRPCACRLYARRGLVLLGARHDGGHRQGHVRLSCNGEDYRFARMRRENAARRQVLRYVLQVTLPAISTIAAARRAFASA